MTTSTNRPPYTPAVFWGAVALVIGFPLLVYALAGLHGLAVLFFGGVGVLSLVVIVAEVRRNWRRIVEVLWPVYRDLKVKARRLATVVAFWLLRRFGVPKMTFNTGCGGAVLDIGWPGGPTAIRVEGAFRAYVEHDGAGKGTFVVMLDRDGE